MIDAIVFSPNNSLEFQDVRSNVIRIPEVSARLSEVEETWEKLNLTGMSIHSYFSSDDEVFLRNIKMKNIASAIAQVGLYDRYLKHFRRPAFMVGSRHGATALKVVVGRQTLNNMILEVCTASSEPSAEQELPQLSGVRLTEYVAYQLGETNDVAPKELEFGAVDINKIIRHLVEELSVKKLVNVGPGHSFGQQMPELALSDVQILDSIDLDPMLNWFWPGLQRTTEVQVSAN